MARQVVELTDSQQARLRRAADRCGTTEADLIRQAVDHLLSQYDGEDSAARWRGRVEWMRARAAAHPGEERGRTWTRDELHERGSQ
ncbi:MAG: hypothetical protein FJX75_11300 [Armatimonadetes bacterium]|nr:hypothetical protein [Armatimonadota bacterium]